MTGPLQEDPDLVLVQLAQGGDQRAFEVLVLKYRRRIERLIARLVRDPGWVEDLAQEAFLKAYRALPQFRGEAMFYTWLYRIALNTAKKQLMRQGRDPVVFEAQLRGDDSDETSWVEREQSTDETPESALAAKELAVAVNDSLQALPEEFRQALVLREIEGLPYDAIAEAMGTPIGTVRSRIYRAREAVASRIRPLLGHRTGRGW